MSSSSAYGLGLYETTPTIAVAGSLLCAGAAMVPDCDHHSGTIAYSLPPVSRWICRGVAFVSGGHREGTHSLLGIGAFWLISAAASLLVLEVKGRDVALGGAVIAMLMIAFAAKVFGLARETGRGFGGPVKDVLGSVIGPWLLSLTGAGLITWFLDYRWEWLPFCIALGCFIHIVGDMLTPQGVPWLWPFKPKPPKFVRRNPALKKVIGVFWLNNGRFRIPLLGTVELDGPKGLAALFNREAILAYIITIYIAYLLAYEVGASTGLYLLP